MKERTREWERERKTERKKDRKKERRLGFIEIAKICFWKVLRKYSSY